MTIYVVTGASGGIGYELCRQIKAAGNTPIAVCRTSTQNLDRLGIRVESGIDIAVAESVADLQTRLQDVDIDVLVNNAGMMERNSLAHLDFDSIRRQFEVNAIGTLRVTHALLPNLPQGGKIVLITSRMGSIADNSSGGSYGYRMSKVAMSMAGKSLSIDLHPRGIAVAIVHPGLVSTPMTGNNGIPAAESVRGILGQIDRLNLHNSGTFWHANGEELPW